MTESMPMPRSDLPFHFLARGIIVQNGQLLVAQFSGTKFTFLPGGHADPGEGLRVALKRELAEELGIQVMIGSYLGAVEYLWTHDFTGAPHYEVNHAFEVQSSLPMGIVRSLDRSLQFHWAPLDALDRFDLRPESFRQLIQNWAAGDRSLWWATNLE